MKRRSMRQWTGFPAHAGMDPDHGRRSDHRIRLPRTRGDGPGIRTARDCSNPASPHTRGWTPCARSQGRYRRGFPAHAGMDRPDGAGSSSCLWLPRTRGDGPAPSGSRIYGPRASPHTRGWTVPPDRPDMGGRGFPAHAGMDLASAPAWSCRRRLPRTRGDGPEMLGTKGDIVLASPHTRGWTLRAAAYQVRRGASPHTRGWTPPLTSRWSA